MPSFFCRDKKAARKEREREKELIAAQEAEPFDVQIRLVNCRGQPIHQKAFTVRKEQTIRELKASIADTCGRKADVKLGGVSLTDDSTVEMAGIGEESNLVATTKDFRTLAKEWYAIQSANGKRPDTPERAGQAILSKSFWEYCSEKHNPNEMPSLPLQSLSSQSKHIVYPMSEKGAQQIRDYYEKPVLSRAPPGEEQQQAMKDFGRLREGMIEHLKRYVKMYGTTFDGFETVVDHFHEDFPFYSKLHHDGWFMPEEPNMYDM